MTPMRIAVCIALTLVAGCAGVRWPKTVTQGDITPQRKQRAEEFNRHFDQQRDSAEFESARNAWLQQGDPQGCRDGLEKLLARQPRHLEARLLMVELSRAEDDCATAALHAKAALDAYPNDARSQYAMATALDAQGKSSDALAYYERAAKMDPGNESFGGSYHSARDAAREDVQRSKATQLGNAKSWDAPAEVVATAAYDAPQTPAPSEGADRAAEIMSGAQAALAEGKATEAMELFHRAIRLYPDNPQIPISAAAALLRVGRLEPAIEILAPAAKRFEAVPAIHRMLGAAYYRAGDYKSSQVALQQALSLDKSSALSYLLMGYTLTKLGQNDTAEAHFRQARTLDPRYSVVR